MIQELRDAVTDATALVAEIGARFASGDPVPELVAQLESRLSVLAQVAAEAELPADLQDAIATLQARVDETVTAGDEWLAQAGPELASEHTRQRLRRAYGVP